MFKTLAITPFNCSAGNNRRMIFAAQNSQNSINYIIITYVRDRDKKKSKSASPRDKSIRRKQWNKQWSNEFPTAIKHPRSEIPKIMQKVLSKKILPCRAIFADKFRVNPQWRARIFSHPPPPDGRGVNNLSYPDFAIHEKTLNLLDLCVDRIACTLTHF